MVAVGHNYWPPSHDDMLLEQQPDQPDWQRLEQLYGLSTVLQRIQWLQNSVWLRLFIEEPLMLGLHCNITLSLRMYDWLWLQFFFPCLLNLFALAFSAMETPSSVQISSDISVRKTGTSVQTQRSYSFVSLLWAKDILPERTQMHVL